METKLRKLQLTELEILIEIDKFCKKNDIKYSLYAGTLLGAVRHKGFIPWDDDLDICMSRSEYIRFINLWNESHPDGYMIQNKLNSPDFSQSFSKIRKDHTTFMQEGEKPGRYHMGIFVDVFPIDRIPNGKLSRYLFLWRCMKYQLFIREYIPKKNGKFIKFISRIILKITPPNTRKKKCNKLLKTLTKNNKDKSLNTVAIETYSTMCVPLPPDLMEEFIDIEFEGRMFKCVKKCDEYLKIKFNDYMRFPPVNERTWKHHPIILDFDRNYEERKID